MPANRTATTPVNQAKIAREAQVSQSTVSRVLNDSTGVDPDKKQRVLEAIERLGYRPHALAQGLARGQSMTIGVVTPHISSPFSAEILGGVETGLRGTGYHAIFASAEVENTHDSMRETIDLLLARRVDALVVLQTAVRDELLSELATRVPLVMVGRLVPGLEGQCITFENERAAHLAVRTLIEAGHSRIAHVSGPLDHHEAIQRHAGYQKALEEAGIAFDARLHVEGDYLEPSGVLAVNALLARGRLFTAVFASDDPMAYGVRLGLYRQGLRVPDDVSLVGFDDQRVSKYMIPPLTTIRQPTIDYGVQAAQVALDLIAGRTPTLPNFEPELIRRESVAVIGRSRPSAELARHS